MTDPIAAADEYRKGHLMMSAVFRTLTDAEREELVGLLKSTAEPTAPTKEQR